MSGRLKFAKNWPAAARFIFGEELLQFDQDGAKDRERRAALEKLAEERRLRVLKILDSLEEKTSVNGTLQTDYVKKLVETFGRDFSLYVYAPDLVNRVIAPPPPEEYVPPPPEEEEELPEADFGAGKIPVLEPVAQAPLPEHAEEAVEIEPEPEPQVMEEDHPAAETLPQAAEEKPAQAPAEKPLVFMPSRRKNAGED